MEIEINNDENSNQVGVEGEVEGTDFVSPT
jgi:hypothetical protein